MGYNKAIYYGGFLELYEYEKEFLQRGFKQQRQGNFDGEKLAIDRSDPALSSSCKERRADSARRASLVFRRLVLSNLCGVENPVLFTLTYSENIDDLRVAYRHFTSFIKALRYKFGQSFQYIAVPEFQKRGAVHFHALFWGLPTQSILCERRTRFYAGLWAKGFLYIRQTDGDARIASYLSKYMSKTFTDPRLKGQKAFVASRNCKRPNIMSGIPLIWPILDEFVPSGASLAVDKSFSSQWLGNCRFRLYEF